MAAVASSRVMLRSCAIALFAFAFLTWPAVAADTGVAFHYYAYSPNNARIAVHDTLTFTPDAGNDFENTPGTAHHPLHFDDNTIGDQTSGSAAATRHFDTSGVFTWYCLNHGAIGMKGKVVVTDNQLPVADFTASATSVPSGTEVTFDGSPSHDPDGAINAYAWDLDGNGQPDPGQTAEKPSAIYTNTGTTPRSVTVRLTVTDNNGDNVGPESTTKLMLITVQPAGGGGTATPPPGDTLPAPDTTAPVVKVMLARKLTVTKTLRVSFTTSESTSVTATLKVAGKTVKARKDFAVAGSHTLTIKLSKSLRRLLRHRRTATLTLAATDDSGNGTTLRRTLKLKAR
jgi:plastocyanin